MIKDSQRNRERSQPTAGSDCTSRQRASSESSQPGEPQLGPRPTDPRPTDSIQIGLSESGPTHSGHPPWRGC